MFDLDEEVSIDLTPLVDVIIVLLFFFILTASFSKPILEIVLPKAESPDPGATRTRELVISIKQDGTIHHEGQQVSKEALPALLETMPDALLNLHVDEKAPFNAFVSVVDQAKTKRGGRFVISTQATSASKPL